MVFSLRTAPTGVGVGAGMTGLDEGAEAADKDEGATVAGLDKGTAAAAVEAARLDLETGGIAEEGLKGWSFLEQPAAVTRTKSTRTTESAEQVNWALNTAASLYCAECLNIYTLQPGCQYLFRLFDLIIPLYYIIITGESHDR